MSSSRIRFWTLAMPVISISLAVASVGFQYARKGRLEQELKKVDAYLSRTDKTGTWHHEDADHGN